MGIRENFSSWREVCIDVTGTVADVVEILNKTGARIVLILDQNDLLMGAITDGDLRRAMLNKFDFSLSALTIANKKPLTVSPFVGAELVRQQMLSTGIYQIPVISLNHKVVGLHLLDTLMETQTHKGIFLIMAGGVGKRMRPHTDNCPKPLLQVAGKPIIERIIERAANQGFRNFVISLGYLGHMIEEYFGDGSKFGFQIEYVKEVMPLGTAGALSLLTPKENESIIVTNGDVLTDINYSDFYNFHIAGGYAATIAVKGYEYEIPYGVVNIDGDKIVSLEEKPIFKSYINAGVYALSNECLTLIPSNEYIDMTHIVEKLIDSRRPVAAYPMHEPWIDVGRPEDFFRADKNYNGE